MPKVKLLKAAMVPVDGVYRVFSVGAEVEVSADVAEDFLGRGVAEKAGTAGAGVDDAGRSGAAAKLKAAVAKKGGKKAKGG